MKIQRKYLFILILITLSLVFSGTALASTNTDYSNLFSQIDKADGAAAEKLAISLSEAFNENPVSFIKALESASLSTEQTEKISNLLAYKDLGEFKNILIKLKSNHEFSAQDLKIIDCIVEAIKKIEANQDTITGEQKLDSQLKPTKFSPYILLSSIKCHDNSNTQDEEYFESLGNAYRADPELFVKTISNSDLTDAEKKAISKFVANDFIKKNQRKIDINQSSLGKGEIEIFNAISSQINNTEIPSTNDNNVIVASTQIPTIGSMDYTTAPLVVNQTETLKFTLTESTATNIDRTYFVKVYGVRNGTSYLKASSNVTIPAGSSSKTVYFNLTFSSTGPVYTLVKVYSYNGGSLLTQRQGTYPDNVYGYWLIDVDLPTNRNYKGTLSLYGADNSYVASFECLGRSVSNESMYVYQGNTPTGDYTGYLDGPYSPSSSYGTYKVVNMTGVSGVIVESGRSGIWIHGGDPSTDPSATWYPLRPTYGCVRISNSDQNSLQNKINNLISNYHYNTGKIHIW